METLRRRALDLGAVDLGRSYRKNKKYYVLLSDGSIVHFGDKRYEDFTTHRDPQRQARYLARALRIKDGNGYLTANNIRSANFWAVRLLWL